MERFTLEIELGNDAMQTPWDVAAALRETATKIAREDELAGTIRDENGNTVGRYAAE